MKRKARMTPRLVRAPGDKSQSILFLKRRVDPAGE